LGRWGVLGSSAGRSCISGSGGNPRSSGNSIGGGGGSGSGSGNGSGHGGLDWCSVLCVSGCVLCWVVLCCVLCWVVLCFAVWCCVVLCCVVLCCGVLVVVAVVVVLCFCLGVVVGVLALWQLGAVRIGHVWLRPLPLRCTLCIRQVGGSPCPAHVCPGSSTTALCGCFRWGAWKHRKTPAR
jgi:hypothetical protein